MKGRGAGIAARRSSAQRRPDHPWGFGVAFLSAGILLSACRDVVLLGQRCPADLPQCSVSDRDGGSQPAPDTRGPDTAAAIDGGPRPNTIASEPVVGLADIALETGSFADYCAGRGPPLVPISETQEAPPCHASIPQRMFSHALCTCENVAIGGALMSDTFDARLGPFTTPENGAAIGINGTLVGVSGSFDLRGSLLIAGPTALQVDGMPFRVLGDLKTNGSVIGMSTDVQVARDAWIAGDIALSAPLQIARDLYQPKGRENLATPAVGGQVIATDVAFSPPCACNGDGVLDTARLIEAARADAHNGMLAGLPVDDNGVTSLSSLTSQAECGRFVIDGPLEFNSPVTVRGRLALFVNGDVTVRPAGAIDLGTSGELDLFVAGALTINDLVTFGPLARPSALRIYVASTNTIALGTTATMALNLYAPRAPLEVWGLVTTFGSLFVRSLNAIGVQSAHYDRAILDIGPACESGPGMPCDGCGTCPVQLACVAGRCGACSVDSDCCEPFVCAAGSCQPLVLPN